MNDAGSHSPPDLSPAPLVPEATPESDVPAAPSPSPAAPPNAPINASPDHPIDLTTESEAFDGGIARGSPREGSLATSIDSEPALELAAKEKDIPSPAPTPIVPPDGGLTAWLAVASAFFLQFAAIGLRDSMGVYQRYFTLSGTFPGSSSLSVSFIGSIAAGVWAGVGPLTSYAIAKIGFRRVAFCGGVLFYVAYTLASFANALWVLYITQGAMVGVAFAFCYFPAVSILPSYFSKRRGLALGLAICGSGLGGFASANYTQAAISSFGWPWALRINGLVSGTLACVAAWWCKPLVEKRVPVRFGLRSFLNPKYFKNRLFVALYLMGFFQCFAFYVPFQYVAQYGASIGLSATQSALATSMLSIGSTVGRFGLSAIGDYAGPLNMWFLCQLLATSLFILWPTVNAYATLILFAIAYGLATGGFVSLYPMCITNVLGADNLAEKIGSVYNGFIFGTIAGGPIAGALIDRSTVFGPNGERLSTNYWPVAGYGFAVSLLSYLCVIYIRWEMGRKAAPGGRRVAGIGII